LIHIEHPFPSGFIVVLFVPADDIRSKGQVVNFRLSFASKVVSFRVPKPGAFATVQSDRKSLMKREANIDDERRNGSDDPE
jgi:hypothetical protein